MNSKLFENTMFGDSGVSPLQVAGVTSPRLTDALYPIEELVDWHCKQRIDSIAGDWIESGIENQFGFESQQFHQLSEGCKLLEDGFRVLTHPKLKFGDFLHHLGMDQLSRKGLSTPLAPASLADPLMQLGLSKTYVNELLTVNVSKVLNGGLSVVCAGADVYMCCSDAIPHTLNAAGGHFLLGAMELAIGVYPAPNVLLIGAGLTEIAVGGVTAYRSVVDPVLPILDVPGTVFFPAMEEAVLLSSMLGACTGFWTGQDFQSAVGGAAQAATASSLATVAKFATASMLGPFGSVAAGIGTAMIFRKMLNSTLNGGSEFEYEFTADDPSLDFFPSQTVMPFSCLPDEPIGQFVDGELILDADQVAGLCEQFASLL